MSVGDRVANGVGSLTGLIPIPGAKYVGKYGTEATIDAGSWVVKQFGKNETKQVTSKLPLKVNLQLFAKNKDETEVLYHYTNLEGADAILNSGVIRANRGKVYLTDEKVNILDANAILFAGERPEFMVTHRIEIKLKNDFYHLLDVETQSNELIFRGSIRNGKHADFNVKENDF